MVYKFLYLSRHQMSIQWDVCNITIKAQLINFASFWQCTCVHGTPGSATQLISTIWINTRDLSAAATVGKCHKFSRLSMYLSKTAASVQKAHFLQPEKNNYDWEIEEYLLKLMTELPLMFSITIDTNMWQVKIICSTHRGLLCKQCYHMQKRLWSFLPCFL